MVMSEFLLRSFLQYCLIKSCAIYISADSLKRYKRVEDEFVIFEFSSLKFDFNAKKLIIREQRIITRSSNDFILRFAFSCFLTKWW